MEAVGDRHVISQAGGHTVSIDVRVLPAGSRPIGRRGKVDMAKEGFGKVQRHPVADIQAVEVTVLVLQIEEIIGQAGRSRLDAGHFSRRHHFLAAWFTRQGQGRQGEA